MWDCEVDPGTEKACSGKSGEIKISFVLSLVVLQQE